MVLIVGVSEMMKVNTLQGHSANPNHPAPDSATSTPHSLHSPWEAEFAVRQPGPTFLFLSRKLPSLKPWCCDGCSCPTDGVVSPTLGTGTPCPGFCTAPGPTLS